MKKIVFWLWLLAPWFQYAQSQLWTAFPEKEIQNFGTRYITARHYLTYRLDFPKLKQHLRNAPDEVLVPAEKSNHLLEIPFPDGSLRKFKVSESPIMPLELSNKYPEIKTFAVRGADDPYASGRIDYTYQGFHAMIQTLEGTLFIDPYGNQTTEYYIVYWREDFTTDKTFRCLVNALPDPEKHESAVQQKNTSQRAVGSVQRVYRLAVCTTVEYTNFHGGTKAGALSAINTTVNRVNQVLNRDLAIRFNLIPNNDTLIFTGSTNSDPFDNSSSGQMIGACQMTIDARVGSANYDIGHVFATDGAGLAQLEAICTSDKGQGVTGIASPVGDPFDIDYVAHEMGHQLGGTHTFNNCSGNGSPYPPAYEPGSGVTIMAYAGICGSTNIDQHSIDIYHQGSFYEITGNTLPLPGQSGWNCAQKINTNNTPPQVDAATDGYTIPISTPFQLTAQASDLDGDSITYCWEQIDSGPISSLSNPSGTAPLFRSWLPTNSPTRIFPRLTELLQNTTPLGERLPTYTREMNFAITVRDNRSNGGGSDYATVTLYATATAGPFRVTYPNTNITWQTGAIDTVKWNVANTTQAPVNCQHVNILLSIDGGYTYPYVLASNTPNDGIEPVTIPASIPGLPITTCRIKVEAADNIFFDISNVNFRIEQGSTTSNEGALGYEKWVTLYPNPAQESVWVLIQNQTSAPISLELFDLHGKKLAQWTTIQGNYATEIPIHSLSTGIYFMKFHFDNQIVTKKLIKN